MDRENLEWRLSPSISMTDQNLHHPHPHPHPADAAFFPAAGNNNLHDVVSEQNHRLPPEIIPAHMNNTRLHLNPTYNAHYDINPLELEFNRLSLTAPPQPPAVMAPPPPPPPSPHVNGSAGGSIIRNNSSVDMSHGIRFPYPPQQYSNGDIQRLRVQSAARGQMGLFMQPHNYRDHRDINLELSDYNLGNLYTSSGRSLNEAATAAAAIGGGYHQPRANQNSLRSSYDNLLGYVNLMNWANRNNNVYRSASAEGLMESNYMITDIYQPRSRLNFSSSLEDMRGKIHLVAKDQNGCRFLQNKFEEGTPDEIHTIFGEVKEHICELMIDQFGNYVVQKLFEVCNEEQMTQLLLMLINDERKFKDICIDIHGTRAVQKMVEHVRTPDQRSLLISVLKRITVPLIKNSNGHHVIQHCLRFFSTEHNKHILNVVADNCLDIATDKSGCCVLQQCVHHARGEPGQRLFAEITSNALILAEHPYGNYVVQYILGLRIPEVTANILAQLSGSYVTLSMNKYGSNVVEKCLKESQDEDQVFEIINEIMKSPNFLRVLQDPFGNYVAQCALTLSRGSLRIAMMDNIMVNYAFLHSHPHGKRVLARTKGSRQRV